MGYDKRQDGRSDKETRPVEAKTGVIARADGSAWFKIGKTAAYAAVYGPRELYPRFLQNPTSGILRCHYNMMPFSGSGERVRPGANRRAKEISIRRTWFSCCFSFSLQGMKTMERRPPNRCASSLGLSTTTVYIVCVTCQNSKGSREIST